MRRTAVFAYGSLVDPASAELTLGHQVAAPVACRLRGWRRAWTTGRENLEVEKTFARAGHGSLPRWCLGLNLEPCDDEEAAPNGALIMVTDADLDRLDVRELRYRRQDVSAGLAHSGGGAIPGGFDRVVAYVARPEHHHPQPPADAIVIASYVQAGERAFARLGPGELDLFRATTPAPPVEIAEAVLVRDRIPAGNPRDW